MPIQSFMSGHDRFLPHFVPWFLSKCLDNPSCQATIASFHIFPLVSVQMPRKSFMSGHDRFLPHFVPWFLSKYLDNPSCQATTASFHIFPFVSVQMPRKSFMLGHDRFLPHSFQFTIHQSPSQYSLYSLSYLQCR